MTTAEQVRELISAGQWYPGAGEFTINRETVEQVVALVGALETKLETCRLVMAEQDRTIAAMPGAYLWG